jgi:hypothetical protein
LEFFFRSQLVLKLNENGKGSKSKRKQLAADVRG